MSLVGPTRTEGPAETIGAHWEPADLPAEHDNHADNILRHRGSRNMPENIQEQRADLFRRIRRGEFARFLDRQIGPLWMVADNGDIMACGGVALDHPEAGIATLCWGMVAADKHRHGIGSALLQHRINYVAAEQPTTRLLRANTTQLAQGFFERHGFVAVQVMTSGYGAALDHVVMNRLNPR